MRSKKIASGLFQSQPQSLFRVYRVEDLIAFGQACSQQIAHRLIIIHDQDFVHAHASI